MQIIKVVVGSLETNCYILKTQKEALVIDPGGEPDKIKDHLEKQKVTVVNTHFHFDHTLANHNFNAEVWIHEGEKEFVDFKVDRFLKQGDILKIGQESLEVFHTPGHTPGGICLLGNKFAFTGDTLFKNGYGRTDLPGGDDKRMFESLKKLYSSLKEGQTIYPGHGPSFLWSRRLVVC